MTHALKISVAMLALVGLSGCDPEVEDVESQIVEESEFRAGDAEFCDQVFTFEHQVPVGNGVTLRVVEKFSPASVLALPRRAILMLPGTLVSGDMYDMYPDSEHDFNALDRAARAGFFAFAVTYEGYPGSSQPQHGGTVTAERTLQQLGVLVELIRISRLVPRVDLMGASFGSSLATALGGTLSPIPKPHIGRIVLQALVYKEVTPLFQEVFFSPEVQQALLNAPNGYVPTGPEMYGLILAAADPAAAAWGFENFPDLYATGPTLEGFDLPVFDGKYGRAPALQFWGTMDPITPFEDVETFHQEYGGPSELRVMPGAGHAPFIADPELSEAFWSETFEFLDYNPIQFYLVCAP